MPSRCATITDPPGLSCWHCSGPPARPLRGNRRRPRPRIEVAELSATEARTLLGGGTLTARQLTQAYLDRIAAIDDAGPTLNAVIELNPQALADADARDAERQAGKVRGPLHGLPVLIKDNVDVAGLVNSAGSLALADHRPAKDAFLVTRLRDAGAVILGKTNLSEWANFRSDQFVVGLELARRADEEPVCARSQSLWLELGHRVGHLGQPGGVRRRHRDRRQHHLPGLGERARRTQADGRPRQPARHHPDLGVAGHGRADDADGGRCRAPAERAGGARTPPIPPARRRPARWPATTRPTFAPMR